MSTFSRLFGGGKSNPEKTEKTPTLLFTREERDKMLEAKENLRYLPVGTISKIATEVGCERQYVHQVINAKTPFTEQSPKAQAIWRKLQSIVENHPELEQNREIINTLEGGEEVEVKMPSRKARFFERKFSKLGIEVETLKKPTTPITYTFIPVDNE